MKKLLFIFAAAGLLSCEKNTCKTCTETKVTKFTALGVNNHPAATITEVDKYALCDEEDISAVNGVVTVGAIIYTGPLNYHRTTTTTVCK